MSTRRLIAAIVAGMVCSTTLFATIDNAGATTSRMVNTTVAAGPDYPCTGYTTGLGYALRSPGGDDRPDIGTVQYSYTRLDADTYKVCTATWSGSKTDGTEKWMTAKIGSYVDGHASTTRHWIKADSGYFQTWAGDIRVQPGPGKCATINGTIDWNGYTFWRVIDTDICN